jgi:hypothetical protein
MKRSTAYQSYLLRFWQEEVNGIEIWRASLESIQTRKQSSFTNLAALYLFLLQQVRTPSSDRMKCDVCKETENENSLA